MVQLDLLRTGIPHGVNRFVDVDRTLSKTAIENIFDVGANRGQSATEFRRWFPRATIHCFEPMPETFVKLRQATRALSVTAHQLGLSDASATTSMGSTHGDSMARVAGAASLTQATLVELGTLDRFCQEQAINQIDYLKVDTEGHDLNVLRGGAGMLSEHRVALVEVEAGMNPDNSYHASSTALSDFLLRYGYRLFGIYEQTPEWLTGTPCMRRANLLFISPKTIAVNSWTPPHRGALPTAITD